MAAEFAIQENRDDRRVLVEQFPSENTMVAIVLDDVRTIQNHLSDNLSSGKVEVWEVKDTSIT